MLAREQRVPDTPLPPVQAYADFRRFGVLPRAGGSFDQPAGLMADMRLVHGIVSQHEAQERKRGARRPKGGR